MEDTFKKYEIFRFSEGCMVDSDPSSIDLAGEAFLLFKELFDDGYGSIREEENLVSIHSGGWSENECLIREFKKTSWWFLYYEITAAGGHYFFNTDTAGGKEWEIRAKKREL